MSQIAAGAEHGCALGRDSTLWCWGNAASGRVGNREDHSLVVQPERVGEASDWRAIATGDAHSCAINDDGALYCWGDHGHGQLGLGETSGQEPRRRIEPDRVAPDFLWKAVGAGARHTCGSRRGGRLMCWGSAAKGRTGGVPTTDEGNKPKVNLSAENWSMVAAGGQHTCALRDQGTLWCWGVNARGQLGLGYASDRDGPEQVGERSDWSFVTAGAQHTCAIRKDKTLWCWGRAFWSLLGQGDMEDHHSPTQVGEGVLWSNVAAGGSFTLAIQADGVGFAWGDNRMGQLGTGTRWRVRPTQVKARQD